MKLKRAKIKISNDDSVYADLQTDNSFDELEAEEIKPKQKGRQFIISQKQIDKFTIKRTRELLEPSRCRVYGCTFDVAKVNGFLRGWNNIPESERTLLLDALQEHVNIVHNRAEEHIVDEEDLPTRWLGSERGLGKAF